MRRKWLRSTQPHPPARALSARNGIFGCGDRAPKIAERDNELPQRLKRRRTDSGNPGTNGLLEPDGKIPSSAVLGGGHGPGDHLLTGLLFDDTGHPMAPTHATKAGIRYRYHVSRPCLHGETKTTKVGSVTRVPAADIEDVVVKSLDEHLRSPSR